MARVGFLSDPLPTLRVGHDSTFALMLECERRGHEVLAFEQRDLGCRDGTPLAWMQSVRARASRTDPFTRVGEALRPIADLDVLFLRKDPPVDPDYLWATQIVELAGPSGPLVVNAPAGLREANEKLFPLRFPDLVPPTLVSADPARLAAFCGDVGGSAVVKPLDGFGGRGIFWIRQGDPNAGPILEAATAGGARPALVQAFIPEGRSGDKRIILLDGEPLGALLRVPQGTDFRCNMAAGGKPEPATLTGRDREICRRLAPALRDRGLALVGIDVIGPYLTEVNVTSPTGLAEIDVFDHVSLEAAVLDWVEARIAIIRRTMPAGGPDLH